MGVRYSAEANAALERCDATDRELAAQLDAALDDFERAPGDQRFRTRSYRGVAEGAFAFVVRGRDRDVLVLWQQNADDVIVQYIGPPDFAAGSP